MNYDRMVVYQRGICGDVYDRTWASLYNVRTYVLCYEIYSIINDVVDSLLPSNLWVCVCVY